MVVVKEEFGSWEDPATGETVPVYRYKLGSSTGVEYHLLSYGAGICGVVAPDRQGDRQHVVLGFDDMQGYVSHPYQGSTVGRVSNRIKGGSFSLAGQRYSLSVNNNGNTLHGGTEGWSKRVWESSVEGDSSLVFTLVSKDGDQGFPGTVMAQVRYSVEEDGNALRIQYRALTSAPTPVNMTNHAYFNLAGHGSGAEAMSQHLVYLACDRYVPVDGSLIPTGEMRSVTGDPGFDLRKPNVSIREAQDAAGPGSFDHCFILQDSSRGALRLAARVLHQPSGRALEVHTTEPGVQFYTANFLPPLDSPMKGREGACYSCGGAFCLEPQDLPDAINQPSFPDSVLRPGQTYEHTIVYKFTVQ